MEREMEKKEKKPAEEEKKAEEKPKPEYAPPSPPKPEVAPKKPEEKPVVIVKPKPELAAPPTQPAMSRNAERTYNYLREHGVSTPLRIAKELNMNPLTVMKALKELEKRNKILLQNWRGGELRPRKRG